MTQVLDAEKAELKVNYCIPDWLREEQIKLSCARFPDRFKEHAARTEPVAIVCFGPSLNQTWEKIKDFKYTISCSGSHGFLRERNITPTWHVEVDPREHKIQLIGDSIGDTEFLMASCCHPKVFDHLVKHRAKITLWHSSSGEGGNRLPLIFPKGELVLTGGANVGLRAFVIARILGFKDFHIFGMDGCFPEPKQDSDLRHASFHPNVAKKYILAEYEGKQYATTPAFLKCARETVHEVEVLSDIKATFYGEGLVQDMMKKTVLKKKDSSNIALSIVPTISREYAELNRQLHESNPTYGISVLRHIDTIKKLYEVTESKSLLDYGCGKGLLAKNLDFPIWEYDPAIPGKDEAPRAADLLICVDVLEHIEPELLDYTLIDISRCMKKIGYFIVATYAAKKILPDGRNTHLIQEGKEWWQERLSHFFNIPENGIKEKNGELHIVVAPKKGKFENSKPLIVRKETL